MTPGLQSGQAEPGPFGGSVGGLVAAIRNGRISAVEVTSGYLDRIDRYDGAVNAFRTVTRELALSQAEEVDRQVAAGDDPGPLAGVPVALKDNIAVAGVEFTAGSTVRDGVIAETDSEVYARLRAAGAVLLGKLNMSEWAIGGTNQSIHYGDVHNPWDLDRVSGGSSGGSGAAIAADFALVALGTDTGGSIRGPSSLNGCAGLRPSVGRISNRGLVPLAWSFDVIGPMARRAEDAAAVFDVIAGYDSADPVSLDLPVPERAASGESGIEGMRIGFLQGPYLDTLGPGLRERVEAAAERFEELGAVVEELHLPGYDEAVAWTADLLLAEGAWVHRERLAEQSPPFAPDVLRRLRHGESVSGAHYGRGRQWQREWRREFQLTMERFDLLLCAGAGRTAPLAAESEPQAMTAELARYFAPWTLCGAPAMSVPCGFVDELPVGMQLIGGIFDEAAPLRAATAYQGVTDWHLRRADSENWLRPTGSDPGDRT